MSRQENVSLQTRMDIERKEELEPDGVTSYHVMLEQLASPTGEQQQKTVKYGRQLLIKRHLIEGSSSLHMYVFFAIYSRGLIQKLLKLGSSQ